MVWLLPAFTLPIPSLPRNIQHRFLSFILKRFLGRFVKSDSLDGDQIDSQIGVGFIEVRDIVLDNENVNNYFHKLPLSLRSGSITKITANLPWPNILSAPISLSLENVSCVFEVDLAFSPEGEEQLDLSQSVVGVAEDFVHSQQSDEEERELNEQISLPGGFLQDKIHGSDHHEGNASFTSDEASGVTAVSALIENVLSRFKFNSTRIDIKFVFPDGTELSLEIPKVVYSTKGDGEATSRVAEFSSLRVSINHGLAFPLSTPSSTASSMDENTSMLMSQSIASLDEAASVYHSFSDLAGGSDPVAKGKERTLLYLGGKGLIVSLKQSLGDFANYRGLSISIETGLLAAAVIPSDIGLLSGLTNITNKQPSSSVTAKERDSFLSEILVVIPGVNFLLVPSNESDVTWQAEIEPFLAQPTSQPPQASYFHLQAHTLKLQQIAAIEHTREEPKMPVKEIKTTFSISDMTLFSGFSPPTVRNGWKSVPMLLPDNCLFQETRLGAKVPSADWRPGKPSYKPSSWRSKVSMGGKKVEGTSLSLTVTQSKQRSTLRVDVTPLLIFVDLSDVQSIMEIVRLVEERRHRLFSFVNDSRKESDRSNETTRCNSPVITPEVSRRLQISQSVTQALDMELNCAGIRLQVRCSLADEENHHGIKRSGVLMIDILGFHAIHGVAVLDPQSWRVHFQGITLSSSRASEQYAILFLSVRKDEKRVKIGGAAGKRISSACTIDIKDDFSVTMICFDVLRVTLDKRTFDALQYFADDVSRFVGGGSTVPTPTSTLSSQSSRLLGSRYFAGSNQPSIRSLSRSHILSSKRLQLSVGKVFLQLLSKETQLIKPGILTNLKCNISEVDVNLDVTINSPTTISGKISRFHATLVDAEEKTCEEVVLPSINYPSSSNSPMIDFIFTSYPLPETSAKASKLKLILRGVEIATSSPDIYQDWVAFFKSPPETFESVPPSEKTLVSCQVEEAIFKHRRIGRSGLITVYNEGCQLDVSLKGSPADIKSHIVLKPTFLLFVPDEADLNRAGRDDVNLSFLQRAKQQGNTLLLEVQCGITISSAETTTQVEVEQGKASVHLCADTISPLGDFFSSTNRETIDAVNLARRISTTSQSNLFMSMDEDAFARLPSLGLDPDLLGDDLPTNLDYLDTSYAAGTGLTATNDDDVEFFEVKGGHETIKILDSNGIHWLENYFDNLPPQKFQDYSEHGVRSFSLRAQSCDISLKLYDGYDWRRTRVIINEHRKEMRRRLVKLRGVLANGQGLDPHEEPPGELLFNSVYIGLDGDTLDLDPPNLMAAIDEELAGAESDIGLESSWQTVKARTVSPKSPFAKAPQLARSTTPSIEVRFIGIQSEIEHFFPGQKYTSRTLITAKEMEILDHMRTSTWARFLTSMRSGIGGNIRETDSDMVRIELLNVPTSQLSGDELRLRAKLLPLRLHVDQDALDFFKAFLAFKYPDALDTPNDGPSEPFFQQVEVFPVHIKLDYKPKRVDYKALREGKSIELMNFFHFDGAEMVLRHITLSGISGWPRMFDALNDLWTPDVKANQLSDFLSGVAPVRSLVNIGSGVADLVLLPVSAYKEDRRVTTGLQKGARSFLRSTALETLKVGARLATGTQVILEKAENIFSGQMGESITAEALSGTPGLGDFGRPRPDIISRYANQPEDIKDGLRSAYNTLSRNFSLAGQTILALPLEIHERSGSEGAVRTVVRAVPIALLRPMIGASEAVSKTLLGLRNTVDPAKKQDDENKYKHH